MTNYEHVVVHYAEIALKAQNRGHFENLLGRNIRRKLGEACTSHRRESGQITLTLAADADRAAVCDALARVPGVAFFSPAWKLPLELEAFQSTAVALLAGRTFATFKGDTRRSHKQNAFRSMEVNRQLGAAVLAAYPDKRVRMADPDVTVKLEITERAAYMSTERMDGVGGLPTNPRQKVVALLSGGLDSPVAAYLMMKRGCEALFVHFQNRSQATGDVENKIVQLAAQLSRYQVQTRLMIVPFDDLQRAIIRDVKDSLRMLFYRRLMLQLAARVAVDARARYLVTGDSLSQVASQTYDNLAATYADSPLPVLAPAIGMDKQEIVAIARRIGTFDISSQPYADCCSFFVPKHPELHARADHLRALAGGLALDALMDEALAAARTQEW
ncbi:MAG: tRNA 4-thiouridine(8) synthase ThiI [Verrucomicrobia bacterium]|nr:tRNA 4-thiouridine(8) synthase ThiI [Verrucomicrobiota bacterium]